MPFEHACFLSYRSLPSEPYRQFVDDVFLALENEIRMVTRLGVFRDVHRFKTGYLFNEGIRAALCRSICLVAVFTDVYFDDEFTYCAREFRAMELLEHRRLAALGMDRPERGLIIPLVLRGPRRLPEAVKSVRQFRDFSDYYSDSEPLSRHPKYREEFREIADFILDWQHRFDACGTDVCADCDSFELPTHDEARDWVRANKPRSVRIPRLEASA